MEKKRSAKVSIASLTTLRFAILINTVALNQAGKSRAPERESLHISVHHNGPLFTAMVAHGAANSSRKLAAHGSSAVEFQKRPSVLHF